MERAGLNTENMLHACLLGDRVFDMVERTISAGLIAYIGFTLPA